MEDDNKVVTRILTLFFRDPARPLTAHQVAKLTYTNRGIVMGVLQTLSEFNILKPFYHSPTNKQFLLRVPFRLPPILDRIRQILPFPESEELRALATMVEQKVPLYTPELKLEREDYSTEEWDALIGALVPHMLTTDRLYEYKEQAESSVQPLERMLGRDLQNNRLGPELPELARARLIPPFCALFLSRFSYHATRDMSAFLKRFLPRS
jgi:hypothetical protein